MAIEVLGQVLIQRALRTPPNLDKMDAYQNKMQMLIQRHKFHVPSISAIHPSSVIYNVQSGFSNNKKDGSAIGISLFRFSSITIISIQCIYV